MTEENMDTSFMQVTVSSLTAKQLIIAHNIMPTGRIVPVTNTILALDGTTPFGKWVFADRENIEFYDGTGNLVWTFNGMEARNGSAFLTGDTIQTANLQGFERAILYPAKPVGDFRVCISSHVDYAEARTRCLRSLKKAGVKPESVLVVIGGAKERSEGTEEGFSCLWVTDNFSGFTALAHVPEGGSSYWFHLHDTCDVNADFLKTAAATDMGINFDFVTSSPGIGIGFYRPEFISVFRGLRLFGSRDVPKALTEHARLFIDSASRQRHVATKDIYGTGTRRHVLYLEDLGVKKYRRVTNTSAKP